MHHPFQCTAVVKPPDAQLGAYLLAACGPDLLSVCLESGDIVSRWAANQNYASSSAAPTHDEDERPAKKAKKDPTRPHTTSPNNIIKLSVSASQRHAVAVTEDKHVRVFSADSTGVLAELSSRCMPKRPCAIQILPDNATIVCGDKFGDVYSLPLLSLNEPAAENGGADAIHTTQPTVGRQDEIQNFRPSATSKTVHTQRNLKSLAAQQSQKNAGVKSKEPLKFEHQLLLGHVSVLTDLVYATREVSGISKRYIITADRDEHIRISRAAPQSHVIEGYCLGHREFVSKLCLVPGTDLLISGDGDGRIGVWDWPEFKLRRWLSVKALFGDSSLVVSSLTILSSGVDSFLAVACEQASKLALLHTSKLATDGEIESEWSFVDFDAPVIDICAAGDVVLLSFDIREGGRQRIRSHRIMNTDSRGWQLVVDSTTNEKLQNLNVDMGEMTAMASLDDMLYGLEKLRKRGSNEDEIEDA